MADQKENKSLQLRFQDLQGVQQMKYVSLGGYIDSYNAEDFQAQVRGAIDKGFPYLIFDMGEVNYISSAGIGAFMAISKFVEEKNGDFVLLNLSRKVLEVFTLLGFNSFFKIESVFCWCLSACCVLKAQWRSRKPFYY